MTSRVEFCHACHAAVVVKRLGNGVVTCKKCLSDAARVWWK